MQIGMRAVQAVAALLLGVASLQAQANKGDPIPQEAIDLLQGDWVSRFAHESFQIKITGREIAWNPAPPENVLKRSSYYTKWRLVSLNRPVVQSNVQDGKQPPQNDYFLLASCDILQNGKPQTTECTVNIRRYQTTPQQGKPIYYWGMSVTGAGDFYQLSEKKKICAHGC